MQFSKKNSFYNVVRLNACRKFRIFLTRISQLSHSRSRVVSLVADESGLWVYRLDRMAKNEEWLFLMLSLLCHRQNTINSKSFSRMVRRRASTQACLLNWVTSCNIFSNASVPCLVVTARQVHIFYSKRSWVQNCNTVSSIVITKNWWYMECHRCFRWPTTRLPRRKTTLTGALIPVCRVVILST